MLRVGIDCFASLPFLHYFPVHYFFHLFLVLLYGLMWLPLLPLRCYSSAPCCLFCRLDAKKACLVPSWNSTRTFFGEKLDIVPVLFLCLDRVAILTRSPTVNPNLVSLSLLFGRFSIWSDASADVNLLLMSRASIRSSFNSFVSSWIFSVDISHLKVVELYVLVFQTMLNCLLFPHSIDHSDQIDLFLVGGNSIQYTVFGLGG